MAPANKRARGSAAKKDMKVRRRPGNAQEIYKRIGSLCGEECDQPVTDAMDVVSEYSDDDYEPRTAPVVKTGRVTKPRAKKAAVPQALPMRLGVQKAQRYICEALDFGLNAGYITPKDKKGKVLVLSPDLLKMSDAIKDNGKRSATSLKEQTGSESRRAVKQQQQRKQRSPDNNHHNSGSSNVGQTGSAEVRDDDVEEASRRGHRRRSSSKRRHGRRRSGHSRSRSRSRSKRRAKRRHGGRSRSLNAENELRKQNKTEESQQDAMDDVGVGKESGNAGGSGSRNDQDDEDTKSTKSNKSSSSKQLQSSDRQGESDDKKHSEEDEDCSTDDEDVKKK